MTVRGQPASWFSALSAAVLLASGPAAAPASGPGAAPASGLAAAPASGLAAPSASGLAAMPVVPTLAASVLVEQVTQVAYVQHVAAATPLTRIAAFGDSVPSGARCDCTAFPGLIAEELPTATGAAGAANLAKGGLTSRGLLAQLSTKRAAAAIADSDVVLITIGANDFAEALVTRSSCRAAAGLGCYRHGLSQLQTTMGAILRRVAHGQREPGARVLVTGYWNVFKDGAVGRARGAAYVRNSDALTRRVNAIIAAAAARTGAQYVDIYTPFKGNGSRDDTALLASDGDHPNARGHRLIAATLLAALSKPAPARG